jgi:hypothetical protein
MIDLPADVPVLWVGLVLVGATLVGVAGALPLRPAPDATAVARTVDSVAASEDPARAAHALSGESVRLRPTGLSVRRATGTLGGESSTRRTGHAEFAFGPVTPVPRASALRAVLSGEHPAEVFERPVHFQQAVVEARTADATWERGRSLIVRGVSWDGYRVTLVGV